jgi:hypothetical protein
MAQPQPRQPQPEPYVVSELHAKGLDVDSLQEAVLAGHNLAMRTTENDVATRAGYDRWAEPLRHLGDVYVPRGFKRIRPGGFEMLASPDDSFYIAVAAGNFATGKKNRMPCTRIERGPLTGQAVGHNRGQMTFNAKVVSITDDPIPGAEGPLTWFLLHYFDERANQLRLELSVPVEFTTKAGTDHERGSVTRFEPRLILPQIALGEDVDFDDEDEGDDEIDIPVSRRS